MRSSHAHRAAVAAALTSMLACASFGSSNTTPPADAAAPEPETGDAAGWIPCAQRPDDPAHFCEDFDDEGRIGYRWGPAQVGGWLDASPDALSPPRALLAHVDPGADDVRAYLKKVFDGADAGNESKATVSAFVRVDRAPEALNADSYFQVLVLNFDRTCPSGPVQAYCVVSFDEHGNLVTALKNLANECGAAKDYYTIVTPLTFGEFLDAGFRKVTLELARTSCAGGAGGSISLSIDGRREGCQDLVVNPLARPLDLQLGIYAHDLPRPGDVSYDDVTVDFE